MVEMIVTGALLVAYLIIAIFFWKIMYKGIDSGSSGMSRLKCAVWAAVVALGLILGMATMFMRFAGLIGSFTR